MITTVYIILNTIMLFALYKAGRCIQKTGMVFCRGSIIGICMFTLNEGLRYGRGVDYNVYAAIFYNPIDFHFTEWEVLFKYFLSFFMRMGLSWQYPVLFMSLTLIIAGTLVLSHFKNSIPYALPLFAILSQEAENLMRWHFAYSFVLIGIFFLLKLNGLKEGYNVKKIYIYYLVFCLIAFNIHGPTLIVGFIFLLLYFIKKSVLSPAYSISLFAIIAIIFNTSYMENLASIFNFTISLLGGKYSEYADSTYFLTGGFGGDERSSVPALTTLLLWLITIIFGYPKFLEKKIHISHNYIFMYNLFTIAFVTWPICNQIELLARINLLFYYSLSILFGTVISYSLQERRIYSRYMTMLIIVTACYFMFVQYKWAYSKQDFMKYYVWNKSQNEKYLDNRLYWTKYQDFYGKDIKDR